MPRDERSLIDLEELEAILRAHEGPPRAGTASARASRPARRVRWGVVAVAAALLVGSGLGFGLASSLTPSGGATDPPAGLGFLPERGWQVIRSRFEASPEQPSFAIASNVPLTALDAKMARRKDWSGYPHQALANLRPRGIVIVASFSLRGVHGPSDASFPRRSLPLRLRDSASQLPGGSYARPLGRYELRAAVGDHNVIVAVYFGTLRPTDSSMVAAQRQLDRLVVGSTRPAAHVAERALPVRPSAGASQAGTSARVVDRTFSCAPLAFGGVGDLDINATPTRNDLVGRPVVAALEVRTGAGLSENSLVVVRSRSQQLLPGLDVPRAAGGAPGVYASSRRCVPVRVSVPLSSRGLPGPPIRWFKKLDCPVRGRALVHVRAVLQQAAAWRRFDRWYDGARQPVVESKVVVRLQQTGKPIAYMEHDAKGGTKLWHSPACS